MAFPICQYLDEIIKTVRDSDEVAISAPTGSGKSLFLPPLFLRLFSGRVRVAIPTTVAVRSAYHFQKDEGEEVGYACGRQYFYKKTTPLVYATTGHFVEKLLNLFREMKESDEGETESDLKERARDILGDLFIIDEIHTATVQATELMGLIKKIFPNAYERPRLLFLTATLNLEEIKIFYPRVKHLKIETVSHPIKIFYHPEVVEFDINLVVYDIVKKELAKTSPRHIIIFRPGIFEVIELIDFLEHQFFETEPVAFYGAHSRLLPDEIDEIFEETGKMKVIVATNILESSITIHNVGVIIDDCLVKSAETSSLGGQRLKLQFASKSEGLQRAGRTGRTGPGECHRLVSKSFWEGLAEHQIREIDRIPLDQLVLRFIDVNLDPESILFANSQRIEQTKKHLFKLGMLNISKDSLKVSEIGKFVALIPLSIQNALMIYLAKEKSKEVYRSVRIVASMIEAFGAGYFWTPRKERGEDSKDYLSRILSHVQHFHEVFRGRTDIHTFLNIFSMMEVFIGNSKGRLSSSVREFAREYSLNNKTLQQMLIIFRELELTLKIPDREIEEDCSTYANDVAKIFSLAYKTNSLSKLKNRTYLSTEGIKYHINSKMSFCRVGNVENLVCAQKLELATSKGVVHLASIIVDV